MRRRTQLDRISLYDIVSLINQGQFRRFKFKYNQQQSNSITASEIDKPKFLATGFWSKEFKFRNFSGCSDPAYYGPPNCPQIVDDGLPARLLLYWPVGLSSLPFSDFAHGLWTAHLEAAQPDKSTNSFLLVVYRMLYYFFCYRSILLILIFLIFGFHSLLFFF